MFRNLLADKTKKKYGGTNRWSADTYKKIMNAAISVVSAVAGLSLFQTSFQNYVIHFQCVSSFFAAGNTIQKL